MDLTTSLSRLGQSDPEPSPRARRLAVALATRLDAVVPSPWRLRAEGGWVSRYEGAQWEGSSDVAGILDQVLLPEEGEASAEEWPFPERVVSVALGVLSATQDAISEATTEPWPALVGENARTDGQRVYLWYGPTEATAVLTLPPIDLAELHAAG